MVVFIASLVYLAHDFFDVKPMKRNFIKKVFLICASILFLGSCGSEEKEQIENFKKLVTHEDYHWICKYDWHFEEYKLICYEEVFFYEDKFKEIFTFFYEGEAMAQVLTYGEWEVDYNKKLDAIFLKQYYVSRPVIKNLGMKDFYFEKFDTDFRTRYFGDAYDSHIDSDEYAVENIGYEIIDWNDQSFIIEDLKYGEYYKYHLIYGAYNPSKDPSNLIKLYPNI